MPVRELGRWREEEVEERGAEEVLTLLEVVEVAEGRYRW
jgi:hypothetical protein